MKSRAKQVRSGKLAALLITLAMLCLLIPATALAATPADGMPTADGTYFFANGTSITITETAPAEGVEATIDDLTTGDDAYISWEEDGEIQCVGVPESIVIFGGADGRTGDPVSVESTSILMTGGTVYRIFGGNYGNEASKVGTTLAEPSVVNGDVTIRVIGSDDSVPTVADYLVGGGGRNDAVEGKVTMEVNNAEFGDYCYIQGGVWGNGGEGNRNIADLDIESNAYVNEVEITIVDSKINYVFCGGSGSTRVNRATVTIGDGVGDADTVVGELYAGGVNGMTTRCTLNVESDAVVKSMAATNRGFVGNGTVTIDGAVETLYTGAYPDCFASDGTDASGTTGHLTYTINRNAVVENAVLSPSLAKLTDGEYAAEVGNFSIDSRSREEFVMTAPEFDAGSGITVNEYTVSAGQEMSLSGNVILEISADATVTNNGTINLGKGSALKVEDDKLTNAPDASIVVHPGASIDGVEDGEIVFIEEPVDGSMTYKPVIEETKNGKVSVYPSLPERGDKVTIKLEADEGYVVDSVKVIDKDGDKVDVTENTNGTYSFIQPKGEVTIKVTFKASGTESSHDCASAQYSDVITSKWYHEAVDYVISHGMMNGITNSEFGPETSLTRGMLVTILWRLEGTPAVETTIAYDDVKADQYYAGAVAWASANGIVTGNGNGAFEPERWITREELATILYRYAQYNGLAAVTAEENLSGFPDNEAVSSYAVSAMNWAVGQGIIGGRTNGLLDPNGNATRAEAAQMLMKYEQNVAPNLVK